jgi:HK97 family phage portal protein
MGLGAFWRRKPPAPQEETRSTYSVGSVDPAVLALFGLPSDGTTVVSESTALTLSAVWRAVSLVAGSIASLPLRTLVETDGQKIRSKSFLDSPGGRDGRYTASEWKQLVAVHLLLHGNAFLHHIRNGAGQIVALYPIHPLSVDVEWAPKRPGGKLFTVHLEDGKDVELDSTSLTQIMGLSLDGLRGLSCIAQARTSLSTGISGDKLAGRQFSSGASISGFVSPRDSEADLVDDEPDIVRKAINKSWTGVDNAGQIAVLSKALTFHAMQLSAADAQFIESRSFSIDEVGRWFGVPPHLLGLTEKSTSWGQGIAEQNRGMARYTLSSWTGPIQERLTLLLSAGKTAEFDFSSFIKPSPEDEIKLILLEVNGGLITPNEGRRIRNLKPVPGGDTLRLPAGMGDGESPPDTEGEDA